LTELRDARRAPFFYVTVETAKVLRANFSGKRLTTARAIYDALAEVANEARSREFEAGRQYVARYAGVTDRTLDFYAREFAKIGLLELEPRRDGAVNLPNVWRLVEPSAGVAKPLRGVAKPIAPPWRSQTPQGWRSQTHPC
jgi:hypothetical protein